MLQIAGRKKVFSEEQKGQIVGHTRKVYESMQIVVAVMSFAFRIKSLENVWMRSLLAGTKAMADTPFVCCGNHRIKKCPEKCHSWTIDMLTVSQIMSIFPHITLASRTTQEIWRIAMKGFKLQSREYGRVCSVGKRVQEAEMRFLCYLEDMVLMSELKVRNSESKEALRALMEVHRPKIGCAYS